MLLRTNFCVLTKFLYGLYSSFPLSFHNNNCSKGHNISSPRCAPLHLNNLLIYVNFI